MEQIGNVIGTFGTIILTVAAVLASAGVIFKYLRDPLKRWLGIADQVTPDDVAAKLDDNQNMLEETHKWAGEIRKMLQGMTGPTEDEVQSALQTLIAAGLDVQVDEDADEPSP